MTEKIQHFPDCHLWGARHYECLKKKYIELIKSHETTKDNVKNDIVLPDVPEPIKPICVCCGDLALVDSYYVENVLDKINPKLVIKKLCLSCFSINAKFDIV